MQQKPRMAFGINVDELTEALRACSGKGCCDKCPYAKHEFAKCGSLERIAGNLIRRMLAAINRPTFNYKNLLNSLNLCGTEMCSVNCEGRQQLGSMYCDKVQWLAAETIDKLYLELEAKWKYQLQHINTVKDVINTMTEDQKRVTQYLVGVASHSYCSDTVTVDTMRYAAKLKEIMMSNTGIRIPDSMVADIIRRKEVSNMNIPISGKKACENFLALKSIEQSADHKTVMVLWKDGTKTLVKRSDNDPDDIHMAFTAACAKKIFGNNTKIKKYIAEHLNEHKPRKKKETVSVAQVLSDGLQGLSADVKDTMLNAFFGSPKDASAEEDTE